MDVLARQGHSGGGDGTVPDRFSGGAPETQDPVSELARDRFGIEYLFPLQRMAIANILEAFSGEEAMRQLVLFPTGFGKSLCFQLPALFAPGPTLVVYPLLALMNDQQKSLEKRGIACAVFRGDTGAEEKQKQYEAVKSGAAKIIITNPESLASSRLKAFLAEAGISHIAVDEAHCVSEWGESFRPSYLQLGAVLAELRPKALSAFTATASPAVAEAIAGHLFGKESFSLVSADIDKPNIRYSVEPSLAPFHTLIRLAREKPKPLIIFGQSRAIVREICARVAEKTGLDARFYHAGLTREGKDAVEAWFMASKDGVLAATCAYGMGVDKRDIRTVIHFSEPPSAEAYIQESGRAGRDGTTAEAVLIHFVENKAAENDKGRGVGVKIINPASEDRRPGAEDAAGQAFQAREALRETRRKAFGAYGIARGCRRDYLHRLMGAELAAPCSGCDVCDGAQTQTPEGEKEVLTFLKFNGGRFTLRQSARFLCQPGFAELGEGFAAHSEGRRDGGGDDCQKSLPNRRQDSRQDGRQNGFERARALGSFLAAPPTCRGAGLLAGWSEEEALSLILRLLALGVLKQGRGFIAKHKLFLAKGPAPFWRPTLFSRRGAEKRPNEKADCEIEQSRGQSAK